jgi:hypothetical protein
VPRRTGEIIRGGVRFREHFWVETERELSRGARISEQPLTAATRQRVDEQVQIVYQAAGQQRPDQGPAAADVDVASAILGSN